MTGKRAAEIMSDETVAKIRKLRSGGVSAEDLASRFGVRKSYVNQLCEGHNRPEKPAR